MANRQVALKENVYARICGNRSPLLRLYFLLSHAAVDWSVLWSAFSSCPHLTHRLRFRHHCWDTLDSI